MIIYYPDNPYAEIRKVRTWCFSVCNKRTGETKEYADYWKAEIEWANVVKNETKTKEE